ncbi:MAG TPA: nucleoside 2-deoxyribosyltransferase [Candidatus Saccharimonadales bacterium]|nr:nucleoside 2-deoxyribosyltransferase [Candidatus Saccharimonadales bacterium]
MKIYLSHSGNYDYESELYTLLRASALARTHQIFFPHDKENIDVNTRSLIEHSDLVLAEVSYPSTGQGIELGRASASGTPILCFYKTGSKISSSLRFVATDFLEYTNAEDMLSKLETHLVARG